MKTIVFDNLSPRPVSLVVEPCAWVSEVASDGRVSINYAGDEDDYVEFAITAEGDPLIAVVSEDVEIVHGEGRDRFLNPGLKGV